MREDRQHRAIYPTELGYPRNRVHQALIEHPPAKGRLAGAIYLPMSYALTGASLSASKLYLIYSWIYISVDAVTLENFDGSRGCCTRSFVTLVLTDTWCELPWTYGVTTIITSVTNFALLQFSNEFSSRWLNYYWSKSANSTFNKPSFLSFINLKYFKYTS